MRNRSSTSHRSVIAAKRFFLLKHLLRLFLKQFIAQKSLFTNICLATTLPSKKTTTFWTLVNLDSMLKKHISPVGGNYEQTLQCEGKRKCERKTQKWKNNMTMMISTRISSMMMTTMMLKNDGDGGEKDLALLISLTRPLFELSLIHI